MKRMYIFLLSALVFASCAPGNNEKTGTATTVEEQHHHSREIETIELDNGQKWKVDENMMVYIAQMDEDVSGFSGSTIGEYKQLASALSQNIEQLTSNCTMEGKAHEELHKWLLPFIELTEQFSASTTSPEADEYYGQIKASMKNFHLHFE